MLYLQVLITSLITGTQVLLLAAGLHLIYATTRSFHISIGAISVAGAYGYFAFDQAGVTPVLSFLGGITVAVTVCLFTYLILKKLIQRSQTLLVLLVSLSFAVALEAFIGIIYGSEGRFLLNGILPIYRFGELQITQVGLWTIAIGAMIATSAYIFLHLLPYGRVVRAIAQHPESTSLMGIDETRVQVVIFIIVGAIAGVVGILSGMNSAITPTSGLFPVIMAFIVLLVGGVSSLKGVIVSSYMMVLIPEFIVATSYNGQSFSSSWKMVLVFLLAMIILLIKPHGIFNNTVRQS